MKRVIVLVAALAAGVLVALAVTLPARAYTIPEIEALGYSTSGTRHDDGCTTWQARLPSAGWTDLGSDCDSGFQARLDAFVAATCPCAQTTTSSPPTTTEAGSPPATTGTTTPADPPPASQPPVTVTVTVTETTPAVEPNAELDTRLTALEQKIGELTTRLERLELAGTAAHLAYEQALISGADPAGAAAVARGTYLNAEYGLGAFA